MIEARNIMIEHDMRAYEVLQKVTEYKSTQQIIKEAILQNQNDHTIEAHKTQCIKGGIPDSYKGHVPKTRLPVKAVGELLQQYGKIPMNYDRSYIPQIPAEPEQQLINYLVQGDNNPIWYKPEVCRFCKTHVPYHRIHNLLACKQFKYRRSHIIESIVTEIETYAKKLRTTINSIIDMKYYSKLLDIILFGTTNDADIHEIFSLIVGGKLNQNLRLKYRRQITRMLISHTILLIQATHLGIPTPKELNITEIKGHKIVTEDLEQGKIVVRAIGENNKLIYINIRHLIESLDIPQLEQYNIGLGSASTRTEAQKRLANKYIQKVIKESDALLILPDGSIYTGPDDKPTTFGGYGGILVNKETGEIIKRFYEPVITNDPQKAELHGIYASIQLANELYKLEQQTKVTILCDCKNAVKYVNDKYTIPHKYGKIYQYIKEESTTNNSKHITIKWIPGHTNNPWNEEADKLAKLATKLHKNSPVTRSLDGTPVRNFRPRLVKE